MLKSVKVHAKKKKGIDTQKSLVLFTITGTSNVQMTDLNKLLAYSKEISWNPAQCPILYCSDHWVHTLSIVSLGCDALHPGVTGFGPKQVRLALYHTFIPTLQMILILNYIYDAPSFKLYSNMTKHNFSTWNLLILSLLPFYSNQPFELNPSTMIEMNIHIFSLNPPLFLNTYNLFVTRYPLLV